MTNHFLAYLNIALMLGISRRLRKIMTSGVSLLKTRLAKIFTGKMLIGLRLIGCSKIQTIIAKFGESLTQKSYHPAGLCGHTVLAKVGATPSQGICIML
jgi:hypothetical protein